MRTTPNYKQVGGSRSYLRAPSSVCSRRSSSWHDYTPVVALFIPVAQEWAARFGFSISKLLLPMNHLVILAGMCTLIGTSTT